MIKALRQLALGLTLLLIFQPVLAERPVTVKRFADIAQSRTLQFPATVINLQLANVAAEISGRIISFPPEVGDEITTGQRILEIECKSARINQNRVKAGLKRLQANRQLTRQQLERAKRLNKSSSISREELDQRQTQLDADNASIEEQQALLESASQAVDNCVLKAPFSGIVIEKMSSVGSYAQPGSPVVKLLKQDAIEVELEIPPQQVPHLKRASQLSFEINQQRYPLKLRKILPAVNTSNFQQRCRLAFIGPQQPVGGSLGLVRFETRRNYLPPQYVQKRQGKFGVFIVQNNVAAFHTLPNAEEGQSVAVQLADDALVISSHLQLLSDRESVSIQPDS